MTISPPAAAAGAEALKSIVRFLIREDRIDRPVRSAETAGAAIKIA
jgi:hypothetical protein